METKTKLAEFHNTLLLPGLELTILAFATDKYFIPNMRGRGMYGRVGWLGAFEGFERKFLTKFNLSGSV